MTKHKIIPRKISHKFTAKDLLGRQVVRGKDWKYDGEQDDYGKAIGTVVSVRRTGWVYVDWDFGNSDAYEFRKDHHDLDVLDEGSGKPTMKTMKKKEHKIIPREVSKKFTVNQLVGRRVVRGKDWTPSDNKQDNRGKSVGTVVEVLDCDGCGINPGSRSKIGYVAVEWDHDRMSRFNYRHGGNLNSYELDFLIAGDETPEKIAKSKPKRKIVKKVVPEIPELPPVPPTGLSEQQLEAFHKLPDYLQVTVGQRL